jgi:hypothetical protein
MTRHLRTLTFAACVVAAAVVSAQIPAGSLGGYKDLETWTREVGSVPDTEYGLGLQLKGPTGIVNAAFAAVILKREMRGTKPKFVEVTMSPSHTVDPHRTLDLSLVFVLTGKDKKQKTVQISDRIKAYPPGPYAPGTSAYGATAILTAEEFTQIAQAQSLRATVVGVQVQFRPDQLKAVQTLAQKVGLAQ